MNTKKYIILTSLTLGILGGTEHLCFGKVPDQTCGVRVVKTELPWDGSFGDNGVCLGDYFKARDLAEVSIDDEKFRETVRVDRDGTFYHEMFLFAAPAAEEGKSAIKGDQANDLMVRTYLDTLANQYGQCALIIKDGERELGVEAFTRSARKETEFNQAGRRTEIKYDAFAKPHWELRCPNASGELQVTKQGNRFWLFFDSYENTSPEMIGNSYHLGKYMISLWQDPSGPMGTELVASLEDSGKR